MGRLLLADLSARGVENEPGALELSALRLGFDLRRCPTAALTRLAGDDRTFATATHQWYQKPGKAGAVAKSGAAHGWAAKYPRLLTTLKTLRQSIPNDDLTTIIGFNFDTLRRYRQYSCTDGKDRRAV
jgi:hypothetical protein